MELDSEVFNDPIVKQLVDQCLKYNGIRVYENPLYELPRRKFPKMISERLITILPNGVLEYKEK